MMKFTIALSSFFMFEIPASAITIDMTFYGDGNGLPSYGPLRNRADMPVYATGTMTIADSAVAPDAFIRFGASDFQTFQINYNDGTNINLFDNANDFSSDQFSGYEFGLLFDAASQPLRFSAPGVAFSNSYYWADLNGSDFFPGYPYMTLFIDSDYDLGFAEQDFSWGSQDYVSGDVIDANLASLAGVSFTPLAGDWLYGHNGGAPETSGYVLFDIQNTVPGAVPEPATWVMMISGFGLVGGTMRRRRHEASVAA